MRDTIPAADRTAFETCLENRDWNTMIELIDRHRDTAPDAVAPWLDDALRKSCMFGETDTVEKLVARGADVNAPGAEALKQAASGGYVDTMKLLVERGADMRAGDDVALRWAAQNGNTDAVAYLLDNGADIHAGSDAALRNAAGFGHPDTVKLLLERGADPNALDGHAIKEAVSCGRLTILQDLVEHGANIYAIDGSALATNRVNGHDKTFACVGALFEQDKKHADAVFATLKTGGIDIDKLREPLDETGATGLIVAARAGRIADVMDACSPDVTFDDLAHEDKTGRSALGVLSGKNRLVFFDTDKYDVSPAADYAALIQPEHWAGNKKGIARLWPRIPSEYLRGVVLMDVLGKIDDMSERDRHAGITRKLRHRKVPKLGADRGRS